MTTIGSLTISKLAEHCWAEAERYRQYRQSNEVYCLELFRRALSERSGTAWQAIYDQYQGLVTTWVQHYSRFPQTGEEAAFFINEAFARMWQFGSRPETAGKLDGLGKCLNFLKACAWSAIEDHLRKLDRDALKKAVPLEVYDRLAATEVQGDQPLLLSNLRQALWETVQNSEEHLVAEESWVCGLAPRHIYSHHPELFVSTEAVSQIKRNILKRLRRRLKLEIKAYQDAVSR